jgi:hypothetical protein
VTTVNQEIDDGSDLPGQRPRSLIVTIYGLYAREVGGWISISSLIKLMHALEVEGPAVRSSISRLKRGGILEPERYDGHAGYALTAQARGILDLGDRRIFSRRAHPHRRLGACGLSVPSPSGASVTHSAPAHGWASAQAGRGRSGARLLRRTR